MGTILVKCSRNCILAQIASARTFTYTLYNIVTYNNIKTLTIDWRTQNKIIHTAFNDNFEQKGATIYLSKQDISRSFKKYINSFQTSATLI